MNENVTQDECRRHRAEIDRRLADGNVRFARIETRLDSLLQITRIIAGAAIAGVVSLIVLLLTR